MKGLKVVCLMAFLMSLGLSMGNLLLPLFVNDLEIGPSDMGLLFFISNLASCALRTPVGLLSDRSDRRGFMLSSGFLMVMSGALFILSTMRPTQLVLPFILWGAASALYFTINIPLIADLTYSDERVKAFGMVGIAQNVAITIGPILAGVVTELCGFTMAFIVLIVSSALLMFSSFKLPETHSKGEERKSDLGVKAAISKRNRSIIKAFALLNLIHGVYTGMCWTMYPIFFKDAHNLTYFEISLINTVMMLSQTIGFYLNGKGPFSSNSRLLMAFSTLSSSFMVLSCTAAKSSLWFFPISLIFGFLSAFGLLSPVGNSIFMGGLDESIRGLAKGITGTVLRGGMAVGSILMGWLWADYGMIAIFYAGAALLLFEAAVMWIVIPRDGLPAPK